jgi:hypothetical protein
MIVVSEIMSKDIVVKELGLNSSALDVIKLISKSRFRWLTIIRQVFL